jgi:hypothetical protein
MPVTMLLSGRQVATRAGQASLLAVVMMTAALLPTFVSQGCSGCSAFDASGLPASTLRTSPDAWAVVWIVASLLATAALFLAGIARRFAATLNAVAAVAALALSIFEGVSAFPRILGAAELVPGVPVTYVLGPGFYLLLIGSILAVGAAPAMLLAGSEGEHSVSTVASRPWVAVRPWVPSLAGWACLAALAFAVAGAFLPYATLNCGFGCPPFAAPLTGSFAGTMVRGDDGRIVVALLVVAAIAIAAFLAGRRKPLATGIALLLSLAATALVSFDSINAATRVLGWPYAIPTSPELGYYLLQAGSGLAVVLCIVLASADRPTWWRQSMGRAPGIVSL